MLSPNALKTIAQTLLFFILIGNYYDRVQADLPYQRCSNSTSPLNGTFSPNLNVLLNSLSSNASTSYFYKTSVGKDNNPDNRVYGLFMCLAYTKRESCEKCIKLTAVTNIEMTCCDATEAVGWEEVCQLRYSNKEFFGVLDVSGNIEQHNSENVSRPERFGPVVKTLLRDLARKAARDRSPNKYASGERLVGDRKLYAVAQCTGDLSADDCEKCLDVSIANVSTCCYASLGARILSKSCYLRYETYPFYGDSKGSKWNIKTSVIFAASGFVFILFMASSLVYYLRVKLNGAKKENGDQEIPLHKIGINHLQQHFNEETGQQNGGELPYIDMDAITEATDNFAESNMLGRGGFGPVYKGKLSDGREIAVKRLSSFSEQGTVEFTNEVQLIMKLQHKNLVRLLGFCANGEEKLLVYEYMPNGSLDVILFDPQKRARLDWASRLNIASGIAKGMLYLHEDSRLKIVHRDLKPSNVLLDSHMNPKISDFGMARIFTGSGDEASTCRLVGTYGYMAPEYAMEGHYSVKSDVFSFGVLLLEIITGTKSSGFQQSKRATSLIAYAWRLWNEGKALELIDPLLPSACRQDEFLNCVYLGLLYVQEDAYERPTMSSVVVMLNSESETLQQPERPAFSTWGIFNDYDEINVNSLSFNDINISSVSHVN